MKLFVDTDECATTSIAVQYQTPTIDRERVYLPLKLAPQERSYWCWAAIAESLADYYHLAPLSQGNIAAKCLSDDDERKYLTLDAALNAINCNYHWTPGKPSFSRIQHEINLGNPICARVQWYKGKAHFLVINGYLLHQQILIVSDSLHGTSEQQYESFPKGYMGGGGVWTETYWTRNDGDRTNEQF